MRKHDVHILREALWQAAEADYHQALADHPAPPAFSPAYRRWEAALLKRRRPAGKRAACWVLVLLLSLGGGLACIPEVRAAAAEVLGFSAQVDLPSVSVTVHLSGVNSGDYRSATFACARGNGSGLRYWYRNDSTAPSTVYLIRERRTGAREVVDSITVAPGTEGSGTYSGAEGRVFHLRVTQLEGGAVRGALGAAQTTPSVP